MLLEKKLYSQQVIGIIKQDLLDGTLSPGDKVNEVQLSQRLGVSRAPIREALCLLERDGLVISEQNKGKVIAKLTKKQVRDTYMAGATLEAFVAAQTCHLYTAEDFNALENHINSLTTKTQEDQHIAFDDTFHNLILKYCDNDVIKNLSRQLPRRISKFLLSKYWQKSSSPKTLYKRHYELYEVLLTKKPKKIEKAILEHYSTLADSIIAQMHDCD